MDDIFDEQGFSKINSIGTIHNFDQVTKVYLSTCQYPLVKGSTLPAGATIVPPIENPKGVNRWDGEKWVDDIEYGNKLRVEERKIAIAGLESELHHLLGKLTLKQEANRITPIEEITRMKIINTLIDLDEFDVEDLTKEIPKL